MTWINTPEQQRVVDEIKARGEKFNNGNRQPGPRGRRTRRDATTVIELATKAAHHANETGATFAEVAALFDVSLNTVHRYFVRLFPGVSTKGRWR